MACDFKGNTKMFNQYFLKKGTVSGLIRLNEIFFVNDYILFLFLQKDIELKACFYVIYIEDITKFKQHYNV